MKTLAYLTGTMIGLTLFCGCQKDALDSDDMVLGALGSPGLLLIFVDSEGNNLLENIPRDFWGVEARQASYIGTPYSFSLYIKGEGMDETVDYGVKVPLFYHEDGTPAWERNAGPRISHPVGDEEDYYYYGDIIYMSIGLYPLTSFVDNPDITTPYYVTIEFSCPYLFGNDEVQIFQATCSRKEDGGRYYVSELLWNGQKQAAFTSSYSKPFFQIVVK